MKDKKFILKLSMAVCIFTTGCLWQKKPIPNDIENISLSEAYNKYFIIGTAISSHSITEIEPLVLKHFLSVTFENELKPIMVHPHENSYSFERADSLVAFALKNGLKIRGHCLIWHEQTPEWFFKDGNNPASRELLLKRMKEHITAVVSRYKGQIPWWNVVNEAIDDDSTKIYRNTPWYEIIGEEYIQKAFEYAHDADPNAQLFYNDYNTERPEKRIRTYQMIKKLIDKKVPIHGIGLQAHWSIYEPTKKDLEETIKLFASLGLRIHITELDVSIFAWEKQRRKKYPAEEDFLTPEFEEKFNNQYEMVFRMFMQYHQYIDNVTFWGISDKHSWLQNYPVEGRKNHPLLYDENMQPKKIFYKLIQLPFE